MGKVEVVGRRDMYDIDAGTGQHLFNGAIRLGNMELPGLLCRAFGVVAG
jgi:hypothetical protein